MSKTVEIQSSLSSDPSRGSCQVTVPALCPCCCGPIDDSSKGIKFEISISDYQPSPGSYYVTHVIEFPYCRACLDHIQWHEKGAMQGFYRGVAINFVLLWVPVILMTVGAIVDSNLLGFLAMVAVSPILFVPTYLHFRKRLSTRPESPEEHAIEDRWAVNISRRMVSDVVSFDFANHDYAEAFREANQARLWNA